MSRVITDHRCLPSEATVYTRDNFTPETKTKNGELTGNHSATGIASEEARCAAEILPRQGRVVLVVLTEELVQLLRPVDAVQHFVR